jgi:hypothetical protein
MAGLLDVIQGASNAAAGAVSGPVDLISTGLLAMGLPMPANPVGGSQWMRDRGLTRDPKNFYAGLAGETIGNVLPIVAAAKAPQIAQGLLQAGDNLRAPTPMNSATRGQAGAIVYHGSPYKFDRFDSSKIGKGEGAQAYGHGLYFADSPGVAGTYRQQAGVYGPADAFYMSNRSDSAVRKLMRRADAAKNSPAANVYDELLAGDFSPAALRDRLGKLGYTPQEMQEATKALDRSARLFAADRGNLYKVDLPDDAIARMIDWDKPLYRQAPAARRAVRDVVDSQAGAGTYAQWIKNARPDFQTLRTDMLESLDEAQIAEMLRQRGVPGVRYLDGGSRTAGTGTSNYVVFPGEEGLLQIIGRE